MVEFSARGSKWQAVLRSVVVVVGLAGATWYGWGSRGAWAEEPESLEAQALRYVRQLGADSYRDREAAASWLVAHGTVARDALLTGLKMPDLETRLRAHELLEQILHSGFEARLRDFVAGKPQADAPPNWKSFAAIVGDTTKARAFYAAMFRKHASLLASCNLEEGLDEATRKRLTEQLDKVRQQRFTPFNNRTAIDQATAGTWFFLTHGKFLDATSEVAFVARVYSLQSYGKVDYKDPTLAKLVDAWASSRRAGYTAGLALELCLQARRMKTAVRLARKALGDSSINGRQIYTAAMVLARNGDLRDVPLLEQFLDDTDVMHTHHDRRISSKPIQIRVQDAVLAMLVHLTGQKLSDYGYKHARRDPKTLYYVYTLLFLSDKDRQAALEKWTRWRKSDAARKLLASVEQKTGEAKPNGQTKDGDQN